MSKIQQMIEDGFAATRIAYILNLELAYILKLRKDNNWKLKLESFSEDKIKIIKSLYAQGVSAKTLGIKFSIDKRRVQKWAKFDGTLRTTFESHRYTFFDEHYFDVIDSPEKSYWLGFAYADAYNNPDINSFTIALKGSDKSHLIKLAKLLSYSPDKIIDGYAELNDKLFPTASLKLYSKHLCQTMTKLGCMKAKSFIIKYPTWLKEDLHLHFIRGMFDGDGCLTKRKPNNEWKWSLVSTKEACQDIKNIIEKYLKMAVNFECISKTNNNTYCLEVTGNERIHKMMTWLYLDSHEAIRLDRKYQKYLELIEQQNNRRFSRKQYKVPHDVKLEILNKIKSGTAIVDIAKEYQLHPRTISKIKKSFINK